MTEFIADSKFMALRAEAQETNSLLREMLKVLQAGAATPAKEAAPRPVPKKKPADEPIRPEAFLSDNLNELMALTPEQIRAKKGIPPEAVGKATVETVEQVDTGKTDEVFGGELYGPDEGGKPGKADNKQPQAPVEMAVQPPTFAPQTGQTETGSAPASGGFPPLGKQGK